LGGNILSGRLPPVWARRGLHQTKIKGKGTFACVFCSEHYTCVKPQIYFSASRGTVKLGGAATRVAANPRYTQCGLVPFSFACSHWVPYYLSLADWKIKSPNKILHQTRITQFFKPITRIPLPIVSSVWGGGDDWHFDTNQFTDALEHY